MPEPTSFSLQAALACLDLSELAGDTPLRISIDGLKPQRYDLGQQYELPRPHPLLPPRGESLKITTQLEGMKEKAVRYYFYEPSGEGYTLYCATGADGSGAEPCGQVSEDEVLADGNALVGVGLRENNGPIIIIGTINIDPPIMGQQQQYSTPFEAGDPF